MKMYVSGVLGLPIYTLYYDTKQIMLYSLPVVGPLKTKRKESGKKTTCLIKLLMIDLRTQNRLSKKVSG